MRIPVVISSYNRLELLHQTLDSLRKNTDHKLEIVVVDDHSEDLNIIRYLVSQRHINLYQFDQRVNVATVKNKGIEMATEYEYICMADNDIYFMPSWDNVLIQVLRTFPDIGLIGGKKHPHHNILETRVFPATDGLMKGRQVYIMDNQPGYHFFMRQDVLKKIGMMKCASSGMYGFEDSMLCEKVRELGLKVATVDPPVIYHCGMKNCNSYFTADYPEMKQIALLHPEIKFL